MPPSGTVVGGRRMGVKGNPTLKEAAVGCSDAVCGIITAIEPLPEGGKRQKVSVDCGGGTFLIVVTAWAVEVGNLVAVATVGSFCGDVEVRKTTVSDFETDGKLLDEATLGWTSGAANCACMLPASFEVGSTVPDTRPKRVVKEATTEEIAEAAAKKAAAEEKAAKAKASKDAKAAAKEAKKTKASKEAEGSDGGEEKELVQASKSQLAAIRKQLAAKRKAGEEVTTDDELEAAGFMSL